MSIHATINLIKYTQKRISDKYPYLPADRPHKSFPFVQRISTLLFGYPDHFYPLKAKNLTISFLMFVSLLLEIFPFLESILNIYGS